MQESPCQKNLAPTRTKLCVDTSGGPLSLRPKPDLLSNITKPLEKSGQFQAKYLNLVFDYCRISFFASMLTFLFVWIWSCLFKKNIPNEQYCNNWWSNDVPGDSAKLLLNNYNFVTVNLAKENFFNEIFSVDQDINDQGYRKSGHSCHVQVSPSKQKSLKGT